MGGASPWGAAANVLKLLLVLTLSLGVGTAIYKVFTTYTNAKANEVVISHQKGVIVEQTKRAGQGQEGRVVENKIINDQVAAIKAVDVKKAAVVQKADKKIDDIKADPVKTAEQKRIEVATVQIDTIWAQFCDASGNADPSCKATTS